MSQCAGGCGFYATAGSIYCSKHFNELATPEEKAAKQRQADEDKAEIANAKAAFDAALTGPIEQACEALLAVKHRPGFREVWVEEEITLAFRKGKVDRMLHLAECEEMTYKKVSGSSEEVLSPLLMTIHRMICGKANPSNPGFTALFNHALVNEQTVDLRMVNEVIYKHHGLDMLQKVLSKAKVTKAMLDSVRYSCKAPANVATPEKQALVKLVEDTFKAQQAEAKRKRDEQQQEGEGGSKRARSEGAEEAKEKPEELVCRFITTSHLGFEERTSLDVWTCGAYGKGCQHILSAEDAATATGTSAGDVIDHRTHDAAAWGEQYRLCKAVTDSARVWQPEHLKSHEPWVCFFVTKEELRKRYIVSTSEVKMAFPPFAKLPLRVRKSKNGPPYELVAKAFKDSAGAFFHSRWYSGFDGDKVDEEILAKLTATTDAFKAAVLPKTAMQFTTYAREVDWFSDIIFLVGKARHLDGALVVLVYADSEEEHRDRGS